jgi:hypothetical protein
MEVNNMEIRYECECYNRTLVISFPARCLYLEAEILKCLDQYYDEWIFFEGPYETEDIEDMCLEDYMMQRLSEKYDMWTKWNVEED